VLQRGALHFASSGWAAASYSEVRVALQLLARFTIANPVSHFLCPIILDTPLQQDQDETNATAMITFALKNRPKNMHLVLGTVSMHGVEYKGYSINPKAKESLLRRASFDEVSDHMWPFINEMLGQDQGELI